MLKEILHSLQGAARLARLDPAGLEHFDFSADGFWRSFLAPALGAPIYFLLLTFGNAIAPEGGAVNPAVELLGYFVTWFGFLAIMIPLTRSAGLGGRYSAFVVTYNWCQLFVLLIMLPIMALAATGFLPTIVAGPLIVGITFAALAFLWFIARTALGATAFFAIEVVLLDFVLNQLVFAGLRYLLG